MEPLKKKQQMQRRKKQKRRVREKRELERRRIKMVSRRDNAYARYLYEYDR